MADKTPIANKRKDDSLDLRSDDPSENSRLHAATKIQSSVTPEDYPEEKRDEQVTAATGQDHTRKKD